MKPLKYSFTNLERLCQENNIKLCKDYSNVIVNRDTKIEGICSTENCNNTFSKNYRDLNENKSFYCKKCTSINGCIKRKQTCLDKYGVEHVMLVDEFTNKLKETNLNKYGTLFTFQNIDVKNKIKVTNIDRYGFEYAPQNKTIRDKIKNTTLNKYGVEHILQSMQYKEKYKEISLKKYGCENPSQNEEIKEKKRQTSFKNYGVYYPCQSNEIKNKKIDTCFKKYGVNYSSQHPDILNKIIKNSYSSKIYILPSGNVIDIQGYENLALDELLYSENINEHDIVTGISNVPTISYKTDDGKDHKHYVYIYIPSQNRCIEVKSSWTAKLNLNNIFAKQRYAKELGYKYEIWIYNQKKEKEHCIK
jgi:hypothetical protein